MMSIKRIACVSLALLLAASTAGEAAWKPKAPKYAGIDSKTLHTIFGDGPFMVMKKRTKTTNPEITSGVIIDASPSLVWKVVTDYQNRDKIITGVVRIENLRWEGKRATFTQRNSVKFSFIKFAWDELRMHDHTPETTIVFFDPGSPEETGGYEFLPIDNGKATLLLYSYSADLRTMGFPVGTLAKEMPLVEEVLMSTAGLMVVMGTKDYSEKLAKGN